MKILIGKSIVKQNECVTMNIYNMIFQISNQHHIIMCIVYPNVKVYQVDVD